MRTCPMALATLEIFFVCIHLQVFCFESDKVLSERENHAMSFLFLLTPFLCCSLPKTLQMGQINKKLRAFSFGFIY